MTAATLTLTDFLLARIAEDRQNASRYVDAFPTGELAPLFRRVLAECAAKRAVVELSWHHLGDDDYGWGMEEAKRQILALMAKVYADHPDYQDAWRP